MSNPQPPHRIETSRTVLRPVMESDAEAIFRGYSSSTTGILLMNFERHTAIEQAADLARLCARCWEDGSGYPWAVIAKATGEFLGVVEMRISPPKAEFGYVICERYWGRGYATEACQAVVDWVLAQPQMYRIQATCHPDNLASARVLRKLGLSMEARLENWEARPQLGEVAGPSLMFAKTRPARRI
jgi:RimJ/RimL family protein N-acetyltransferase